MEDRDRPDMLSGRKDWDSTSPPSLEEAACSCFCLSYQSPKDDMFVALCRVMPLQNATQFLKAPSSSWLDFI